MDAFRKERRRNKERRSGIDRRRQIAVEAAIEMIRTSLLSGSGSVPGLLENLSTYANQIQSALEVKK